MTALGKNNGFVFVLPLLAGVLGFVIIPAIIALCLSLCQWSLTCQPKWVGFMNYATLLGWPDSSLDPLFLSAAINTAILSGIVPLQVLGSFLLACFLKRDGAGMQILRLVVFLPTVVSPVALYITWRWVLNADFGLLSQLLGLIGVEGPAWLDDPAWSRPAVMMVILWETMGGFQMLIFLAGFRQIPTQLLDMARLDGFNLWRRIRVIYWPWLKGLFFFNLCLSLLGSIQGGFEIAYLMTGGGPLRSTTTLSYYLFENAFEWQRVGYASAIGMLMFVSVLPLMLLFRLYRGRN